MAQNNPKVSSEVAAELADIARRMRQLVFGGDGVPEWGTKFSKIEDESLKVGRELARLMMQQAVGDQAGRVPQHALQADEEQAVPIGSVPSVVQSTAGEVQWPQPKTRLSKARRDFFPSGSGAGH